MRIFVKQIGYMLYNILSITNNEYLDIYEPNMVVKTIQCKEIAPSWGKEEARNICKELNASTNHVWKIDEVIEKDI